jgi:hypothetical protein
MPVWGAGPPPQVLNMEAQGLLPKSGQVSMDAYWKVHAALQHPVPGYDINGPTATLAEQLHHIALKPNAPGYAVRQWPLVDCPACDAAKVAHPPINSTKAFRHHHEHFHLTVRCHLCDAAFPVGSFLKNHRQRQHPGLGPYKCFQCPATAACNTFASLTALQDHLDRSPACQVACPARSPFSCRQTFADAYEAMAHCKRSHLDAPPAAEYTALSSAAEYTALPAQQQTALAALIAAAPS